ncbi:MAG: dihydrolipoyllysine-residue acetyltransferase [Candidatus Latescibacterota bacterium]|nr:dihydrolipoyllysine-residue acetyltransferase [Candidatus Latescibacterota bacterium]
MAVEFDLPDLGENVESGEVISVLVNVGDTLAEDQPVIELETDKAVIEVPSSVTGIITEILVSQGDTANIGQAILRVDGSGGVTAAPEPSPESAASEATATPERPTAPAPATPPSALPPVGDIEVKLPELGEGIQSGEVVDILVSEGDSIKEEQGLIELEIDKGVVEMPSPTAGVVKAIHVKEGDTASVGQLVAMVEANAGSAEPEFAPEPAPPTAASVQSPTPAPASAAPATAPLATPRARLVPAAPSVRRLAREIGIDIIQVKGTSPTGRISEADVKAHSKALHERHGAGVAATAVPLPDFSTWGEIEREPFSNVRRITAERMTQAWTTIPHVTQFDHADVTELEAWRKNHSKLVEKAGGKLTPTAIILKVVATSLRKFPQFSASIDMAAQEVVYKNYTHVGIAVDTKRGLLVPVIRDVDQKTVTELSLELGEMAEKTRTGRVSVEDMQGGCFTISNLGGIGGTSFTPIVNSPEVAILGVARSRTEAVHIDDEFQPRLIMPLSLSYDHRLIDGADGARFLRFICEGLENPYYLAFEG